MISRFLLSLGLLMPAGAALAGDGEIALLSTAQFAPPVNAEAPQAEAYGTLSLTETVASHFALHKDSFQLVDQPLQLDGLPSLEVELAQDGARVVPMRRGPITASHPNWEWIVQPGTAWKDPQGASWVSLPVALAERNANCVHNGLLKFSLEQRAGLAEFQVASETCAYLQFDLRAQIPFTFARHPVAGAQEILANDRAERAARLPELPLSSLPSAAQLSAEDQVPDGMLTMRGAVLDGFHYVSDCPTRAGPYPYCDEMVLPSYSWAKSLFAGIAAMRLEKLYPGSIRRGVAAYVRGCEEDNWGDVSLADLLNMASGHYTSALHEQDEASDLMTRFFMAETHAEKILIACRGFPKREAPGERFVYRTADTYIAGVAMTGMLRTFRQDSTADIHRDLLQPLWNRLDLSPLMASPRRTYDDAALPFSGWGLYMTRADLVRMVAFLQDGGAILGEGVLDRALLDEAMQASAPPHGLRAAADDQRYRYGFWAWNIGPYLGCAADQWVPLMSGYGGLVAAMLPGDQLYYHISDGGTHRWAGAARAIHESYPICEVTQ